ncbi:MAG: serine/threonine-protein kinase [Acidobacteriota bacterium]
MTDDEAFARADEIFDAALDLPAEKRSRFLDRMCGGDTRLRARVERLLRYADDEDVDPSIDTGGAFRGPLGDGIEAMLDGSNNQLGTHVGPWRLVREIGRGGMAVVYLGERQGQGGETLRAAIKLIRPGDGAGELLRRFRSEHRILAGLDHPAIARLLDAGVADDGRPYLVMDYVEGLPIDQYADRNRLGLNARVELFLRAARVVAHAHQQQVIHRDLKPSHIVVTANGEPKLLDFGIAKVIDPSAAFGSTLPMQTKTGMQVLTPTWASPEQIHGRAVTAASDVYQLGQLLFLLLVGELPYHPATQNPVEVARAVCEDPAETPSHAVGRLSVENPRVAAELAHARRTSPAQLHATLAGDLGNTILRALEKDPAARYRSVEVFIAHLEAVLAGSPVTDLAPTTPLPAVPTSSQRRQPKTWLIATGAIAVLASLGMAGWSITATSEARARATAAEQRTALLLDLLDADVDDRSGGETLTVSQLLERSRARLDATATSPLERAEALVMLGNTYREIAHYLEARKVLDEAIALFDAEGGDPEGHARALEALALVFIELDDERAAAELRARAQSLHNGRSTASGN